MGQWRIIAVLCALAISFSEMAVDRVWAGSDEPTQILKLRGKKLVLFGTSNGKKVDVLEAKKVKMPLDIGKAGEQNNRYPVEINGKQYWITKAQVKKTDKGKPKIQANCNKTAVAGTTFSKTYASSRGLGNC